MKIFFIIYCILGYFACGIGLYLYCVKKTQIENLKFGDIFYVNIELDDDFIVCLILWPLIFIEIIYTIIKRQITNPKRIIQDEHSMFIHWASDPNCNLYYADNLYDIPNPKQGDVCLIIKTNKTYMYYQETWFEI